MTCTSLASPVADRDAAERDHRDRVLDRGRRNRRVLPDLGVERGRGLGQSTDLQEVAAEEPPPGLLVGHPTMHMSVAEAVGRDAMRVVELIERQQEIGLHHLGRVGPRSSLNVVRRSGEMIAGLVNGTTRRGEKGTRVTQCSGHERILAVDGDLFQLIEHLGRLDDPCILEKIDNGRAQVPGAQIGRHSR